MSPSMLTWAMPCRSRALCAFAKSSVSGNREIQASPSTRPLMTGVYQ